VLARLWSSRPAPLLAIGVFDAPQTPAARPAWGVAALLVATGDALAARFGAVAVRGELSGFSRAGSGHCYFALKDADGGQALLRCAMFRRAASLVSFAPADGQQVELRGRLGVYEARGELQMVVEAMQRVGTGTLYEELLRRRALLAAEGLFDAERKRAVPAHPRRLGVVTSLGAAALHDVLTTLQRRSPHVQVVVYPSVVQGAEAPAALANALMLASSRAEVDTLLLVRGGGSLEDLWAFNDERVVRAVAACSMPVICGVGHETDITLADLVADLRAPTPTAAAELAAPARDEALAGLAAQQARLQRAQQRRLQNQAQGLDQLALRLGQPGRVVLQQGQRLDALAARASRALVASCQSQGLRLQQTQQRLQRAAQVLLVRHQQSLAVATSGLLGHDPQRVLRRGYAWVEAADGRPVVSAHDLLVGQRVRAVWADGSAQTEVLAVQTPLVQTPLLQKKPAPEPGPLS
jgi:exodeoxyribonuclease VII large subunit